MIDRADVHGSVHFFVHARIGKPAPEILAPAEEIGADLIIVGSKRMTPLERLILGSTSEHVMREAGCTVEIARAKRYPEVMLLPVEQVDPGAEEPQQHQRRQRQRDQPARGHEPAGGALSPATARVAPAAPELVRHDPTHPIRPPRSQGRPGWAHQRATAGQASSSARTIRAPSTIARSLAKATRWARYFRRCRSLPFR